MSSISGQNNASRRPRASNNDAPFNSSPQSSDHRRTLHRNSEQDTLGSQPHQNTSGRILARQIYTNGMRDGVTVGLGSQDGDVTAKSPSALQTLLASGPVIVHIADERENSNADPNFPAFLKGVAFDPNNQSQWYNVVLPYVRGLVFSVASTADIHFAGPMFGSEVLPQIYLAVTMLRFPGFHWFSGVQQSRPHNPYLQMAAHLPNLRQISFTIHTAGITASAFSERQMIAIEANEPIRAKERRVMRLPDVVEKYNLRALLECRSLTAISIDYIDCERTAHFVRVGDPFNLVRAVQMWLVQEFTQMGQNVTVNLNRAN